MFGKGFCAYDIPDGIEASHFLNMFSPLWIGAQGAQN